ncbi:MAG TPA: hypothetical protein EYM78_11545 [Gemmatimonadetes bacterium]|nr:hypothetical protein [Gemmatimonadota bacterium]HIN51333.1 hypothetical protein [Gemmatimonadota bacterium]
MNIDPGQQPYIDPSPEDLGATPHISDYWTVIARRLWLVLVIFTVTTASSIFKASQSRTTYTATVALQVNDPQERSSGLVNIPSLGGLNLFVDPIESEIQVLGSATIKATVVDSRGMRLARVPVEDARSLIMRDVWVAPDVPDYQPFRLIEEFEGRYDQVIIDSPPVLAVHTDGVVIVLRSRETKQRAAERSVDQLRHLGVRVFGAVLNTVTTANPDEELLLAVLLQLHPHGDGYTERLGAVA